MIDLLLYTTFFILPVAGATLLLIKVLFEYLFRWDVNREGNVTTRSTGIRIIIACVAVALGTLLCFFSIWFLFSQALKYGQNPTIFAGENSPLISVPVPLQNL